MSSMESRSARHANTGLRAIPVGNAAKYVGSVDTLSLSGIARFERYGGVTTRRLGVQNFRVSAPYAAARGDTVFPVKRNSHQKRRLSVECRRRVRVACA